MLQRLAAAGVIAAALMSAVHAADAPGVSPAASDLPPPSADVPPADVLIDPHYYALAWMQTSAEYFGIARGMYAAATVALDRALADKTWTASEEQVAFPKDKLAALPPAVILDADETSFDNTPMEAYQIVTGRTGRVRAILNEWQSRGSAKAVPGVVEFVAAAQRKGITVFFITNRDANQEDATRRNLAAMGIKVPDGIDTVLMQGEQKGWETTKATRRMFIAEKYRVLLMVGDDYGDFSEAFTGTIAARRAAAETRAAWWGERWFVIPNPLYGSWERAILAGEGNRGGRAPPDVLQQRAKDAIKPYK